jgi:hypothetical protein
MRATITQREQAGGVFRQRQEYYVDCAIEWTADERQRIEASPDTLLQHVIAGARDMTYGEYRWSPRSYSRSAPFVLALVLLVGVFTLPHPILDNPGSLALWLALIGYCIFNYFNDHEGFAPSDVIRVATILENPSFSIYAKNAAEADAIAADIRKRLNELDTLLSPPAAT